MKRYKWQIIFAVSLLALSAITYYIHFLIWGDSHHIFIYLVGDIGFVFIEVLLVTLIIHRLLESEEKKARLKKLNMVIGIFFSEVGSTLLGILSDLDTEMERLQPELVVEGGSEGPALKRITRRLKKHNYIIETAKVDWDAARAFLMQKRDFLLRLLENSTLLEHESFTELLWAVFHLAEELEARETLVGLPNSDYEHLSGDMKRVYGRLSYQWLKYMEHLDENYPYLFSLALRKNPFDKNSSPIVRKPKAKPIVD